MGVRVTQTSIEGLTQPDNSNVRVTQTSTEVITQPDNANVRVTQNSVEALTQPDTAAIRATQVAVEVLVFESVSPNLIGPATSLFSPSLIYNQAVDTNLITSASSAFSPRIANPPVFRSLGTFVSTTTGTLTPGLPSGWQPDDILIANWRFNSAVGSPIPSGWTQIGGELSQSNYRHRTYWRRAESGDTAPTFPASGNACARIAAYRNCTTIGTPFEDLQQTNDSSADTSFTSAGLTTTGLDRLVVVMIGRGGDSAAAFYDDGNWAATGITNIVERYDQGHANGLGGGIANVEGLRIEAGACGPFTTTNTNVADSNFEFALLPDTESQVSPNFISSATSVFSPAVVYNQAVDANLISQTTLFQPSVNAAIEAQYLPSATSVFSPSVLSHIASNLISGGTSVFSPAIIYDQSAGANFLSATTSIFQPSVNTGATTARSFAVIIS